MTSIEIIENVFKVTFPPHFKELHRNYLDKALWQLCIYNYEEFYILNPAAIEALNTSKKEGINVQSEAENILTFTQEVPALKDFVPFAISGLFSYVHSFLAFKRSDKNINDTSVYRIYAFTESDPITLNIRKIGTKYSDIIGDEANIDLTLYRFPSRDNKMILRASDHTYSHVFDRYVFLGGYFDSIVKQLNHLFGIFDDIKFSHENLHTIFCEIGGVRSIIFKDQNGMAQAIDHFDNFEETVLNILKNLLGDKLQGYSLHHFNWRFFVYDIPAPGLGLTKKTDIETTLYSYGMLPNNYRDNVHDSTLNS